MHQLRDIDHWFIAFVLPHEDAFALKARRLVHDQDDADDLLQEVYARLIASTEWNSIANPKSYVMRMLHNLAVERIRRARIVQFDQMAQINAAEPADEAPDAFQVVAAREHMGRVMRAIAELPLRNREVVTLRRIENHSPRAIAQMLGVSLSTLEKRLARGMALLSKSLDPDFAPRERSSDVDNGDSNVERRQVS